MFSCRKNNSADKEQKKDMGGPSPPRTVFVSKTEAKKKALPDDLGFYMCSITQEVMEDPVLAMDGFTYERKAIETWLRTKNTSPQTNLPLPSKALVPNMAVKSMIIAWKEEQKKKAASGDDEKRDVETSPSDKGMWPGILGSPVVEETKEEEVEDPLDIGVSATVDRHGLVKISVLAKENGVEECPPVDVVLIMDRSGSMCAACVGVDEDTQQVCENGFNTLDLVKHAMKTCVQALRPCDRCALILFDNHMVTAFELTSMSEQGRGMAVHKIQEVQERGSTNIYGAILEGIKIIEARKDTSRNPSILFFTDGCPNVSPARGEVEALKKVHRQKNITFPVHTFGFGTWRNINSCLLYEIAHVFGGFYGYIPDATFLGTTFVNAISNVLTTAAINVKFHLKGKKQEAEAAIPHVGDLPYEFVAEPDAPTTLVVSLGTVRYGQTTDFVMSFPGGLGEHFPEYYLTYENGGKIYDTQPKSELIRGNSARNHLLRFETIEVLKKAIKDYRVDMDKTRALVKAHIKKFEEEAFSDKVSAGILDNLKGQNTKMLVKEKYMNKWGKHQCRQFIRSINMQIKNNFKDPGVQHFGGKLFIKVSDKVDDIFNNMPPPKPSLATKATKVITDSAQFSRAYNNVQNDYINGHGNTFGGCFSGNGQVKMADGSSKLVRDVLTGDVLATPEGPRKVALVRKDELPHAGCFVNGLWITPKHPVRVEGRWFNPRDLWTVAEKSPNTTWYNIELRHGNSFFINGIELVALGHNNVIPTSDPAYSKENDVKYGRGWKRSAERMQYLKRSVARAYPQLPEVGTMAIF